VKRFGKVVDDLLALFCATNVSFCMQQMKGDSSIRATMYSATVSKRVSELRKLPGKFQLAENYRILTAGCSIN